MQARGYSYKRRLDAVVKAGSEGSTTDLMQQLMAWEQWGKYRPPIRHATQAPPAGTVDTTRYGGGEQPQLHQPRARVPALMPPPPQQQQHQQQQPVPSTQPRVHTLSTVREMPSFGDDDVSRASDTASVASTIRGKNKKSVRLAASF